MRVIRLGAVIETLSFGAAGTEIVCAVRGEGALRYIDVEPADRRAGKGQHEQGEGEGEAKTNQQLPSPRTSTSTASTTNTASTASTTATTSSSGGVGGGGGGGGSRSVPLVPGNPAREGTFVTCLHSVVSPGGGYVLVTTDDSRGIVFPYGSPAHARTLFGATTSLLSNPAACWDADGGFVYTTSEGAGETVVVFELASQRVVARLEGHRGRVRDLDFDPASTGILATVGFDKTLRLWRRPEKK
jgi:WD40 repeat protein